MYKYTYVGDPREICTNSGALVATGFSRIVLGSRGAYVEFTEEQVFESSLHLPPEQLWRLNARAAYYIEYRTVDGVKVYYQKRRVEYADYQIGYWYISPVNLKDFKRGEKVCLLQTTTDTHS